MDPEITPPPGALPNEVADTQDIKASEVLGCSVCRKVKSTGEFSPRKDRPRGFHYLCKKCQTMRSQASRKKHDSTSRQNTARIKSQLWRKENPGHRNALKAAYKAAKIGATPAWLSKKQQEEIVAWYDLAQDCGLVSGQQYQVDHIVPIRGKNVCGLHVPWNLQILPNDINQKKSNSYAS